MLWLSGISHFHFHFQKKQMLTPSGSRSSSSLLMGRSCFVCGLSRRYPSVCWEAIKPSGNDLNRTEGRQVSYKLPPRAARAGCFAPALQCPPTVIPVLDLSGAQSSVLCRCNWYLLKQRKPDHSEHQRQTNLFTPPTCNSSLRLL